MSSAYDVMEKEMWLLAYMLSKTLTESSLTIGGKSTKKSMKNKWNENHSSERATRSDLIEFE